MMIRKTLTVHILFMILCVKFDHLLTCVKEISCINTNLAKHYLLMKLVAHSKGGYVSKYTIPQKPNRFHIKLFQISESTSGYILGFHVYTGKNLSCISNASKPLDPECTKTTKIVLGLLESTNLLDQGHHIYMDNYYTSPELFSELFYRQTYTCGTV